jgi:prepilin-type processing-associated H-X9-DG protein
MPNKLGFVPLFVSPADPTFDAMPAKDRCTYPANWQVFKNQSRLSGYGKPSLNVSFLDGTSMTILLAEHYARCSQASFSWVVENVTFTFLHSPCLFANEVDSVALGLQPARRGEIRGVTFQVRPSPNHDLKPGTPGRCDPWQAQTPHPGGMLVAMADGSVRVLSPSMSEKTYWSAITPSGGETLGSDW